MKRLLFNLTRCPIISKTEAPISQLDHFITKKLRDNIFVFYLTISKKNCSCLSWENHYNFSLGDNYSIPSCQIWNYSFLHFKPEPQKRPKAWNKGGMQTQRNSRFFAHIKPYVSILSFQGLKKCLKQRLTY